MISCPFCELIIRSFIARTISSLRGEGLSNSNIYGMHLQKLKNPQISQAGDKARERKTEREIERELTRRQGDGPGCCISASLSLGEQQVPPSVNKTKHESGSPKLRNKKTLRVRDFLCLSPEFPSDPRYPCMENKAWLSFIDERGEDRVRAGNAAIEHIRGASVFLLAVSSGADVRMT